MVSIIVPVYNVEKYLERCLESILNQTYKSIEIILVDDGSSDSGGSICDDFAKKDRRIKVIHKENGGLSSARNAGIQAATGEYLCFIDSDDWVSEDYIEILLNAILDNNADMAACSLLKTKEEKVVIPELNDEVILISDEKYYYALKEDSYSGFAWNKLYRTSIIRENGLCFDEKIFNGEDLPFVIEYLQYCKYVVYTKEPLYYYYIRPDSITASAFSRKKYTIIYAREKVWNLIMKLSAENTDLVIAGYIEQLIKMKYRLYPQRELYLDILAEINKKIKSQEKNILKLNGVSMKNKIKLYLMVHCNWIIGPLYRQTKGR